MKLTPAQLAALASGATLESLGLTQEAVDAAAAEAAKLEADAKAKEEAEKAEAARLEAEAKAAEEAKTKQPESVTAFLTAQLSEAQSEIVNNRVSIAQLQAQVTEMKTTHDSLLAIARTAVGKMQVALGGSGEAAASLDATAACAEYARLTETFNERYPVGGVAKAKAEETVADNGDPLMRRRVALTPAN